MSAVAARATGKLSPVEDCNRTAVSLQVLDNGVAHVDALVRLTRNPGSLRAAYQPVVEETLPERLRNLLEALDHRENEVETTAGSMSLTNVGGAPGGAITVE